MLWTNTKRITRTGFVNFWRNGFVSLSAVLIMVITLFVIGAIIFTNAILIASLDQIKNKVDVNVSFVTTASESDVLNIKKSLETLPEVAQVEYISRDQALQNFKDKHQNEQTTLQALDELNDNPFGAILNIKAKDPSQYESVAQYLQGNNALSSDGTSLVYQVNYLKNKPSIDKLTHFIDSGRKIGLALMIFLIIISVLITFNTIRLVIFISRDEISVMRLVGAGSNYVRGPFVVSGVAYGLVAGIITILLFLPITYFLGPKTVDFFGGVDVYRYFLANFGQIILIIMASGVAIGGISSYLATKKHLEV